MLNFFGNKKYTTVSIPICFITFIITLLLGQILIERSSFYSLLIWQVLLYSIFIYLFLVSQFISLKKILLVAIICRVFTAFVMPSLSDDVYRFIWDGQLLVSGNNPLLTTPDSYINQLSPTSPHFNYFSVLHSKINHPQFYTCYPPLMQLVFWIAAEAGTLSITASTIIIKLIVAMFDILGIYYFVKILKIQLLSPKLVLLYALNPLVIIEGVGNAHFEVVQVALMIVSMYLLLIKKINVAAVFWGLAIVAKLLPLLLLPLWIRLLGLKKGLLFAVISGCVTVITFLPFLSAKAITGFSNSLDLYFQNFEFNASLYYLARELGWWVKGYNYISFIGPFLFFIFLGCYAVIYFRYRKIIFLQFANLCLLIFTLYYLLATTVHPWYIINLLPFAIITNRRFAIVWLAAAFLSYNAYAYIPFSENLWYCLVEYMLVLLAFIYDVKKNNLVPSIKP